MCNGLLARGARGELEGPLLGHRESESLWGRAFWECEGKVRSYDEHLQAGTGLAFVTCCYGNVVTTSCFLATRLEVLGPCWAGPPGGGAVAAVATAAASNTTVTLKRHITMDPSTGQLRLPFDGPPCEAFKRVW